MPEAGNRGAGTQQGGRHHGQGGLEAKAVEGRQH